MKKRGIPLILALLLIMIISPSESLADNTISNDIEKYVESMVRQADLPGVQVTIVEDGEAPIFINKGYGNIDDKEPVTEETRFELGSNSKAFTGLGLMYLAEQGEISLDDPVKEYLPWFSLDYQGKEQELLVKDFLYQTTGVNPSTIGIIQPDQSDDALKKVVEDLSEYEVVSNSGEEFLYATINYDCIGLIIETVTGESYEQFINDTLLPYYGLNDTYAGKREEGEDSLAATGYKFDLFGNSESEAPIYRGNTPAGYILTDGGDLAKWMELQLDAAMEKDDCDEIIMKSQIPDDRVEPLLCEPYSDPFRYSAGWLVFDNGIVSHGGSNPDYSSYILIDGENGHAVGVLCNRDTSYAYGIAKGIHDILLGNEPEKAPMDIFMTLVAITRIGLVIVSSLLILAVFLLIKRMKKLKKRQLKLFELMMKNKKRIIIPIVLIIIMIMLPVGLMCFSMYSISFLSVWAPICSIVLIAEIIILWIIGMINRIIKVVIPKGELK